jgi:DNA-binding NarL/FixJ family response regulator
MAVPSRPVHSGGSGGVSAASAVRPAPAVAVVTDGSVAMRGVATVLTEAGLGSVREYARTEQLLISPYERPDDRPDVVVVNLGDWGQHGFVQRIRPLVARHRVVAFCPRLGRPDVAGLLQAGVRGCVTWDATATTLVDAVRMVATLGFQLPSPAAGPAEPVTVVAGRADRFGGRQTLTMREREVLQSVSTGLTHKEIARLLGLSKTTVDTYVQRIRQKLGVGNKAELARAAYRFGLCTDD